MRLYELKVIRTVLGAKLGWRWIFFFRSSRSHASSLFKESRWNRESEPESIFVKRLSLVVALYKDLTTRFGEVMAFDMMHQIVVPIGAQEQVAHASSMKGKWASDYHRLEAFHDLMDTKGGPRFNERHFIQKDENICYFHVTRCVFHDFFDSVGVPELTQLFCEIDRIFFTSEFPTVTFHRMRF